MTGTVITVTNLDDSGAGSLRQAIADAGTEPDVCIDFANNLAGGTLTLSSRLSIASGQDVHIMGDIDRDGVIDITISGDANKNGVRDSGDASLVEVKTGGALILDSLALIESYQKNIGAELNDNAANIKNRGDLTIANSLIADNVAQAGSYAETALVRAATVYSRAQTIGVDLATLTVTDTLFENNSAFAGSGEGGDSYPDSTVAGEGVSGIFAIYSDVTITRSGFSGTAVGGETFGAVNGGAATVGVHRYGGADPVAGPTGTIRLAFAASTATPGEARGTGDDGKSTIGLRGAYTGSLYVDGAGAGTRGADVISRTGDGDFDNNIFGFGGNDLVYGGDGADYIDGGSGDDYIVGGGASLDDGVDTLRGGAGDDTLLGGYFNDRLYGGAGDDLFGVLQGEYLDFFDGGDGRDTIDLSNTTDQFDGLDGDQGVRITITGDESVVKGRGLDYESGVITGVEHIIASQAADVIIVSGGAFELEGEGGDDFLRGGESGDKLRGGLGLDTLFGGGENDKLFGGGSADSLEGGDGNDTLSGDIGRDTLIGGIGDDVLKGRIGRDVIQGDDGDDFIIGAAGADFMDGGADDDTLTAGKGKDTLTGGDGRDLFVFTNADRTDQIVDFEDGQDRISLTDADGISDLKIAQRGTDAFVKFEGTRLFLLDFDADDLDAGDFIF